MDVKTEKLVRASGNSMASIWLFCIGMLCGLFVFLTSVTPELGWGEPTAQELMVGAVGEQTPEIVFTNDWRNCGGSSGHQGGCFSPYTPDKIYVSPNLRYTVLKYVVLHELAHYEQFKNNEEISECNADSQAKEWGADISGSGYECS